MFISLAKVLKNFIVSLIFFTSFNGFCLNSKAIDDPELKNNQFIVSGLFGGVVCKENNLIYKKPVITPCTIRTGKNSFLEMKKENGAKIVVGSNTEIEFQSNLIDLKNGSFRVLGEHEIAISGFGQKLKRTAGDQLFFTSKVFKELEFLSLENKITFYETHIMDGLKKEGETKVPAGSWASIGGRFGETLGDFYELSDEQIEYFKSFLLPQQSLKARHE